MQLVALFCRDSSTQMLLNNLSSDAYHLHPISNQRDVASALRSLDTLEFAGALVLDETLGTQAFAQVERSSLEARTLGTVDTVTVTPAGLVGEYNLGRAVGSALHANHWDVRGARVVVLGADTAGAAAARELASLGAEHVSLLAEDRPSAEAALRALAIRGQSEARALSEPLSAALISQADVLVRTDARLSLELSLLGPHLSVIDLSSTPLSPLRKTALDVGAKSLGLRDIQAYQTSLALSHILGRSLETSTFLTLFHS